MRPSEQYKTWGKSHSTRLKGFNYSSPGKIYHVIVCSSGGKQIFVNSEINSVIINILENSTRLHGYILVAYCLMPDHLHMLIKADEDIQELSFFIQKFKSYAKKTISFTIWQRGYYDHILRDKEGVVETAKYIIANPVRKGLVDNVNDYRWSKIYY